MKAVVRDRYGPPEVMRLEDVAVPSPRAGQVLVRVVATSVNLSDWEGLHGSPAYARFGGLFRPSRPILGSDIAGVVVSVGADVTDFTPGDEVYGDILSMPGGFAEYAVAPAHAIAHKPAKLSFAQASTLPQSGAIAVQAVARAKPGRRMLINGAGGGTGAFALQLAAAAGIHVTGVDNAGKLDFMRSLGASHVIDYAAEDYTRTGPYDLIIDLVARRSVFSYRRALAPGGTYLIVGGTTRALLRVVTVGALIGALTGRHLSVLAVKQGPAQFSQLAECCADGSVQIHIDRVFPLAEVPAALTYVGTGRALGKVVVLVDPAADSA
ncbi:NADPH:quinone reductase [Microbacterium sp. cf046]|uniref:NAD(P)-dependent alcohol dehydrogenase n=1 Tax=Microbacterium sp. cf046 TaxID=1761803 RepID=UPI0008E9D8BE|nr:NAD(P)-dependent alcohol dehydrogenase [Microbacterium sp. cf046]SFS17430.1 NADPH:quinone reductase [Microbacterium sp. cf046]